MQALESGTLMMKAKKLEETAEHISRLSIRCTLSGRQYYKLGSHDHMIDDKSYVIINKGQTYKTAFDNGDTEQETILVAFKPTFVENLMHSITTPEDKLLDDPFNTSEQPVVFYEKTYMIDPVVRALFLKLRTIMDDELGWKKEADLDSIYTQMLTRLLVVHKNLQQEINKLKTVKMSTRAELYKRLCVAKDYMDAHPDRRIGIDEVASVAFLSPHHFKRVFKELFGITPHKYHVSKRLEHSRRLLLDDSAKVEDVCRNTGFESSSSFIRLFREHYGCTPKAYHLNNF